MDLQAAMSTRHSQWHSLAKTTGTGQSTKVEVLRLWWVWSMAYLFGSMPRPQLCSQGNGKPGKLNMSGNVLGTRVKCQKTTFTTRRQTNNLLGIMSENLGGLWQLECAKPVLGNTLTFYYHRGQINKHTLIYQYTHLGRSVSPLPPLYLRVEPCP